jgi:hypothetical protein
MHQSSEPGPSSALKTVTNRTFGGLLRGFWADKWISLGESNAQCNSALQLALGARMDNLAKADLLTRIEELTRTNTDLAASAAQHRSDNQTLTARVTELEDDLAAARTSLRRMIRANNLPPDALLTPSTPGTAIEE